MTEVFETGIKLLLASTLLFFLVLFYLCRGWAKPMHPERNTKIGALVAILHSFWFFVGGFIVVSLISLFWPNLINLIKLFFS